MKAGELRDLSVEELIVKLRQEVKPEVHPERIEAIVLEQPADPAGQANP